MLITAVAVLTLWSMSLFVPVVELVFRGAFSEVGETGSRSSSHR